MSLTVVACLLIAGLAWVAQPKSIHADHESTTAVVFEPVPDSSVPNAAGSGEIEYHGGIEPDSRWTATFKFLNLDPDTEYLVLVQGRFGVDNSAEATEFTEVCRFLTDPTGTGGCWYYFVGLRRLSVLELRTADGVVVAQATKGEGPGSMDRTPNAFSLTLTATPAIATLDNT